MKLNKNWFIKRAKERSTWVGIIAVASAFGVTLSPELAHQIATIGVAVAGLVSTLSKDDPDGD